jgi:hypothetical protein
MSREESFGLKGAFVGNVGKPRATVIVSRGEGQLGNRLFQFATFHAASLELGFELWNPAFGDYARHFPEIAGDVFCRPRCVKPLRGSRKLACWFFAGVASRRWRKAVRLFGGDILDISVTHDEREEEYDLGAEGFARHLAEHRFLIVQGWKFRAQDAIWRHRAKLREVLRPQDHLVDVATRSALAAKGDADVLIGVHVRRGDYAGWQGGRFFFEWGDYSLWMRQAVELFKGRRVAFLICSNEPTVRLPHVEGAMVTAGPGGVIEDLYALASCDLLMGPPSTFTLWASYWGGVRLHMLERVGESLWEGGFVMHQRI